MAGTRYVLDWLIAGSVAAVVVTAVIYRTVARTFDRGPRDS